MVSVRLPSALTTVASVCTWLNTPSPLRRQIGPLNGTRNDISSTINDVGSLSVGRGNLLAPRGHGHRWKTADFRCTGLEGSQHQPCNTIDKECTPRCAKHTLHGEPTPL